MSQDFGDGQEKIDRVELGKQLSGDIVSGERCTVEQLEDALRAAIVEGHPLAHKLVDIVDRLAVARPGHGHIHTGYTLHLDNIFHE